MEGSLALAGPQTDRMLRAYHVDKAIISCKGFDLENGIINVDHQLLKGRNGKYTISTPKTEYGTRLVPMTDEVKACFAGILKNRSHPEEEPIVDGKSGFLYLDKNEMPMIALHW